MQLLLAKYGAGHAELPRRYYRKISKMADTAWFVIREQNLRFDWIKDVDRKRPFYFGVLTWYMDRVIELLHDDLDTYRELLAVVHLVKRQPTNPSLNHFVTPGLIIDAGIPTVVAQVADCSFSERSS